ncbi:MAG TPA: adenosylcobinamide amidohydrolase [Thermoleophilia bacterium]|nr:adenosylcobinamide amidohydrolase [Thermoleophilia bacterium]
MNDDLQPLPGVTVTAAERAVRISSERPLRVLGSAVVGGGFGVTREILNVHVDDQYDGERPDEDLAAVAAELGIHGPFVGLMTAAYTQFARCAVERLGDLAVAAVVSVGLSNTSSAGVTPPIGAGPAGGAAAPGPGTINIVLLVDGALTPAAMVNAVITATEAKTMTLAAWDVKTPEGDAASGTSTDTVVVACTGRGEELGYAGPATPVGWLAARAVRAAMTRICEEKVARDGGRHGW